MADTEVTPTGSRVNPADNLEGWLKTRDAEPATPEPSKAAEASPAEPTVSEPAQAAQPVLDWREVVLPDDVDHGFFRGKKVPQVIESYKHAERAKQDAERRAADLERRLAAIEQPKPTDAPKFSEVIFADPNAAWEQMRQEAERIADQKITAYRQETAQEAQKQTVFKKGGDAYDAAREKLNLTPEVFNLRAPAIMLHLTDERSPLYQGENGLFDPDAYVRVGEAIFGKPVAPVVVKQAPEPPPPPGAKKASPATISEAPLSPLRREQIDSIKELAKLSGISEEKFLARARARNKGEQRG